MSRPVSSMRPSGASAPIACIDDLDIIAEADHIMDDVGVDSIETAVAMGVAMEARRHPLW